MQDRELYGKILGIESPWHVESVELRLEAKEVRVRIERDPQMPPTCPEAGCTGRWPIYDHLERSWRHLDTCQYHTILTARVPRIDCQAHGVHQIRVPWAEERSRFTALFEALAIHWMKQGSVTAVAEMLDLSWYEAAGIQERAVARGLLRRDSTEIVEYLGVDEKSFQKRHEYVTVVTDLEDPRVLYVADDRKKESLDGFFQAWGPARTKAVKAIAMDMWEAYLASGRENVPDFERKVVFDKFHVAKHLGDAVDRVRRAEGKVLAARGDDRLKGSRHDWLRNPDHFDRKGWRDFKALRESNLKTARAWAIREMFMGTFWSYRYRLPAKDFFHRWYSWAIRSRLTPILQKARMLQSHFQGLLNYLTHGITNAVSESINAKIQWVKYTARGFRNRDRFRMAILFHCGGLDLDPH